jgi:hypothetical protein
MSHGFTSGTLTFLKIQTKVSGPVKGSRATLEARRAPMHAEEGVEHGDTAGGF